MSRPADSMRAVSLIVLFKEIGAPEVQFLVSEQIPELLEIHEKQAERSKAELGFFAQTIWRRTSKPAPSSAF
jgi:hypothetical protein